MIFQRKQTVAFTGHRTYRGTADAELDALLRSLYGRGFRIFMSGMAVGFDLAAAEAVVRLRQRLPGVELWAIVPFEGQSQRFTSGDRARFDRLLAEADAVQVLSTHYYAGCYAVRNDFLVDHAAAVVAWYDGSQGGTAYTVRRARAQGVAIFNLHPAAPATELELF